MALTSEDARRATDAATGAGGTNTAARRLTDLTKTDNPLMTQSRTSGLQMANQRGMLNSSIAAGASEGAAIAAAAPIATADAQLGESSRQADLNRTQQVTLQEGDQAFQGDQAGLDRTQQTAILGQQQTFQGEQAGLNRTQETAILGQQQTFQGQQAGLDRTQRAALQESDQTFQAEQGGLNRAQQTALQEGQNSFNAEQAATDRTFTANQTQQDRELEQTLQDDRQKFENRVQRLNLSNSENVAAGQMFSSAAQQRAAAQQAIYASQTMSAAQRTRALKYINDEYVASVQYAESLFDVQADVKGGQREQRERRQVRKERRAERQAEADKQAARQARRDARNPATATTNPSEIR